MPVALYQLIDPMKFGETAEQMKAVARRNWIRDYEKFIQEVHSSENLEHVHHGPMVCTKGNELPEVLKKYTRFITFDKEAPLQISYMEFFIENCLVVQLNVVRNDRMIIDPKQLEIILPHFLDMNAGGKVPATPDHVFVISQAKSEPTMN